MNIEEMILEQNDQWELDFEIGGVKRKLFDGFIAQINTRAVFAVAGPRRAGKSFFMSQIIGHLISQKVPRENILNINFEHPFFVSQNNVEIMPQILASYFELKNPKGKIYVFLDEPQNIQSWEAFVRFNFDKNKNIKFFVTGSNSRLLSSEFSTKLTGRVFNFFLPLFNFAEFLDYFKIGYEKEEELNQIVAKNFKQKNNLAHFADKFLASGGFPEIYENLDPEAVSEYARNYVRTVLYADIVPRYQIRVPLLLENLFYQIANNNGSYFSFNNLAKILGVSDLTVKQYLSYLEGSFLIKILPQFSEKSKERLRRKMKIYLFDPVLKKPFFSRSFDDYARDVENLILRHFDYRAKNFYLLQNSEIDFRSEKDKKVWLVNSCYSNQINPREYEGFDEFENTAKAARKIIVSKNIYQKKPVLTVPLWAWLLSESF